VLSISPVDAIDLPAPAQRVVQLFDALSGLVHGRASMKTIDRLSYARDMWPLAMLWIRQGKSPPPPDVVVWPQNENEIAQIILFARKNKLAVIPFGAGSGVCGGTWALQGGITLDVKRLDTIGSVNSVEQTVTVGAGVMGETLERRLNSQGYTLGHFPSSIYMSTVGGWIAARSAGQLSSRYGKIEDMVISLRAILGTGDIVECQARGSGLTGNSDLVPLLVGSEGTFCTFTQATLRVFPLAQTKAFHAFEFESVNNGLMAISQMFKDGLRPAVVRLYDPFDTAIVGKGKPSTKKTSDTVSGSSRLMKKVMPALLRQVAKRTLGHPSAMNRLQGLFKKSRLILMFEGESQRCIEEDLAATQICNILKAHDLGEAPGKAWFKKRYDVSYRMSKIIDSGSFADTMEIAAPWSKVMAVYEAVHQAAAPFAFVLCHFSHAYVDGCSLYFSFVGSGENETEIQTRYENMWRVILDAAVSAGGNVSHHHGVGILKAKQLQTSLGPAREVLQQLKKTFDPDGIMNPGKLGLV
jgi:alkyldihydroxyacetonephosphate synthase